MPCLPPNATGRMVLAALCGNSRFWRAPNSMASLAEPKEGKSHPVTQTIRNIAIIAHVDH